MDVRVDLNEYGVALSAQAPHLIDEFVQDAIWAVAGQALADVQYVLDRSIKDPTPYYETQVTVERAVPDVVVHDRRIVYGPWLEGVSERNKTTRFKGYAAFRRATQSVQRRIPEIVDAAERRLLGRLNA